MVVATPSYGVAFQRRQFTADVSTGTTVAGPAAPNAWVKLTRTGEIFTAQYSEDGVVWNDFVDGNGDVEEITVTMGSSVFIGLAVTSHNSGATAGAEFAEISSTGATGVYQIADVGVAQGGNAPDDLYVGLSSGGALSVVNVGSAPVLTADWVNVKVPLADFAGANLGAVTQISVGVGNPSAPMMGGDGMVLVDNVRVVKPEPEPVVE
jgi:hypothetical protein